MSLPLALSFFSLTLLTHEAMDKPLRKLYGTELHRASRVTVEAAASSALEVAASASVAAAVATGRRSAARRSMDATFAIEEAAALEAAAARKRMQERRAAPLQPVPRRLPPSLPAIPREMACAPTMGSAPRSIPNRRRTLDQISTRTGTSAAVALSAFVDIDAPAAQLLVDTACTHESYSKRERPGSILGEETPPTLSSRARLPRLRRASAPASTAEAARLAATTARSPTRSPAPPLPTLYDVSTDLDRERAATRIAAVARGWRTRVRFRALNKASEVIVASPSQRNDYITVGWSGISSSSAAVLASAVPTESHPSHLAPICHEGVNMPVPAQLSPPPAEIGPACACSAASASHLQPISSAGAEAPVSHLGELSPVAFKALLAFVRGKPSHDASASVAMTVALPGAT